MLVEAEDEIDQNISEMPIEHDTQDTWINNMRQLSKLHVEDIARFTMLA